MSTMQGDSKAIVSNQAGLHQHLDVVVNKHLKQAFKKPIHPRSQQCFEKLNNLVQQKNTQIIIDSCCGVGQSTRILAKQNPDAFVIGIDKSEHRLTRNIDDKWQADNFCLVRADLNDLYRLIARSNWPLKSHYLLYPNPWPKSAHLQRRWHGSAVFPDILNIGKQLILRSNWLLYLEEFQHAASLAGKTGQITLLAKQSEPFTPFEAKFQASNQDCWQLVISL